MADAAAKPVRRAAVNNAKRLAKGNLRAAGALDRFAFHTLFFNEVFMIDPKQGPLFRTRHKAEMSASSRPHPAKHTSAETAPEPKSAGKRPFASKRQFSVVGS